MDSKEYIDNNSLKTMSMVDFYEGIIENNSINNKNLKIQELKIGLTKNYKIRVMIIEMINDSKKYSVMFNRDTNLFKVKEYNLKENEVYRLGLASIDFFKKLDKLKNHIDIPEGDYEYFMINLMFPDNTSITNDNNYTAYVMSGDEIYETNDEEVEGLYFMVYGEPADGSLVYYIVKPNSLNNDLSENTNNFITKDLVMAVEDAQFKVTLEKVDLLIEDSAKENLKTILSSVSLLNKTDEEVFISIKHSWSDDVMESKIPENSSDNIKISTQISKDVNIEDTSLRVEVKSKDNEVIFNHSFGLASEINK